MENEMRKTEGKGGKSGEKEKGGKGGKGKGEGGRGTVPDKTDSGGRADDVGLSKRAARKRKAEEALSHEVMLKSNSP